MQLSFLKSQGRGLIIRVVFYHGTLSKFLSIPSCFKLTPADLLNINHVIVQCVLYRFKGSILILKANPFHSYITVYKKGKERLTFS